GEPRGGWIFLLVVAVISGLGIFAIRLAGGPRVELSPRTSSTSVAKEGLPKQFHELLLADEKVNEKWMSSRWLRIFGTHDPAKLRTLTRQDLQEERELCRDMKERFER